MQGCCCWQGGSTWHSMALLLLHAAHMPPIASQPLVYTITQNCPTTRPTISPVLPIAKKRPVTARSVTCCVRLFRTRRLAARAVCKTHRSQKVRQFGTPMLANTPVTYRSTVNIAKPLTNSVTYAPAGWTFPASCQEHFELSAHANCTCRPSPSR